MSFNRQFEEDPKDPTQEEDVEPIELEKEDIRAMILAGLLTFVPVLILFMGALYLIIYLLFLR